MTIALCFGQNQSVQEYYFSPGLLLKLTKNLSGGSKVNFQRNCRTIFRWKVAAPLIQTLIITGNESNLKRFWSHQKKKKKGIQVGFRSSGLPESNTVMHSCWLHRQVFEWVNLDMCCEFVDTTCHFSHTTVRLCAR